MKMKRKEIHEVTLSTDYRVYNNIEESAVLSFDLLDKNPKYGDKFFWASGADLYGETQMTVQKAKAWIEVLTEYVSTQEVV